MPPINVAGRIAAIERLKHGTYSSRRSTGGPSVVKVLQARLVTERAALINGGTCSAVLAARYRQRVERTSDSGVIVDAAGQIVTPIT